MLHKYVSDLYDVKENSIEFDGCLEHEIGLFPVVPNIRVITQISSEKYERRRCKSNMVFIPNHKWTKPLSLEYNGIEYPLTFGYTRAIRKLLESVDDKHALVFFWDENEQKYYTKGIEALDSFRNGDLTSQVYIVEIQNSMKWVMSVCNIPLVGYENGSYVSSDKILTDTNEKIESITKEIDELAKMHPECKYDKDVWKKICQEILEAEHGTSFVLFCNPTDAKKEAERISSYRRGIMPKQPQDFSEAVIREEYLKQNIAIDGGLIFDISGLCYAYGCIFDGMLPIITGSEKYRFKGKESKGSRHNSMLLYIFLKNHSEDYNEYSMNCIGVVFSDDYDVTPVDGKGMLRS